MTVTSLRSESIAVDVRGILPTDTATQVQARLKPVLGRWTGHSRVRVTRLDNVDLVRPVVAQLDISHPRTGLRAQVVAATAKDAVSALATRAAAQLRQLAGPGSACTPLPTWFPELRPPSQRRLSRNKVCDLLPMTVDEAIQKLDLMDHRVHLFREISTAQDSLVCRAGAGSFRLQQLEPRELEWPVTRPLVRDRTPVCSRTVDEALAYLDLTGRPFEFFADKATGRGRVVYARYDGHYAMLTAAVPLWQTN